MTKYLLLLLLFTDIVAFFLPLPERNSSFNGYWLWKYLICWLLTFVHYTFVVVVAVFSHAQNSWLIGVCVCVRFVDLTQFRFLLTTYLLLSVYFWQKQLCILNSTLINCLLVGVVVPNLFILCEFSNESLTKQTLLLSEGRRKKRWIFNSFIGLIRHIYMS